MNNSLFKPAYQAYINGKRDRRYKEIRNYIKSGGSINDLFRANLIRCKRDTDISDSKIWNHERRLIILKLSQSCIFDLDAKSSRYNITGIDWVQFIRPCSNGLAWVLIAPDEPGNNVYVDDFVLIKFFNKKYINHD